MSEINLEDVAFEDIFWKVTGQLRWLRPTRGDDNDLILQQLFERVTGERSWRNVPTVFED